jgi:Zn-dependent protease with chaperone function
MRKYHEQRDEARGLTTELCVLLAIAVIGTIAVSTVALAGAATSLAYVYLKGLTDFIMPDGYWMGVFYDRLVPCGVLTLLAVAGTALYKSWQLIDGGGRSVARSLGGIRLTDAGNDAGLLRALNVVEELAIATGLRAPPVYVLNEEPGINAFAAGFNSKDAAIGITRGAIDRLERHQLQGVVAHEFGHIVNGDMRLNIQLLGILAGVQSISFAAGFLLRLANPSTGKGPSNKHPLGMILALVFGAALWPIGQIGSLFAMLIHLGVNRQREFLADASAVQFTRDPQGLCEALTILLNDETDGRLVGSGARLASYMFFASSNSVWQKLLQTHPPLEERIRRLDPSLQSGSASRYGVALTPRAEGGNDEELVVAAHNDSRVGV